MIAGTQGGKTAFGPLWLYREIQRCGPGDYIVATPTFPLLDVKALPSLTSYFTGYLGLGRYLASPTRRYIFSEEGSRRTFGKRFDPHVETRILFGYAADPESLESATAKAAWLDEAGQKKFRIGSYYALRRRLGLYSGRMLITTTVYYMGWLKSLVYDRWAAGDKDFDVIQFDSTLNPLYPAAEFQRAKRELPRWEFDMKYRAQFRRPPGLIYDCVDLAVQRIPRFAIPADWKRYVGLDFGEVNMAATFWAEEPETRRLYLYRIYHVGSRSVGGHVRDLRHGELGLPFVVGGSASEKDWRSEFRAAGYPVRQPRVSDVDVGISAAYGVWQRGEAFGFDDLDEFWDELTSYSRVLDEKGNVTEEIEDKSDYHLLDSMRYLLSEIRSERRSAASSKTLVVVGPDPLEVYDRAGF